MSEFVLDASALLAFLHGESGGKEGMEWGGRACISAVNLEEVAGKLIEAGMAPDAVQRLLADMDLKVIPFDSELAYRAAALRPATRAAGLSLADRACLATAQAAGLPAVTTDRAWKKTKVGVEIRLPR